MALQPKEKSCQSQKASEGQKGRQDQTEAFGCLPSFAEAPRIPSTQALLRDDELLELPLVPNQNESYGDSLQYMRRVLEAGSMEGEREIEVCQEAGPERSCKHWERRQCVEPISLWADSSKSSRKYCGCISPMGPIFANDDDTNRQKGCTDWWRDRRWKGGSARERCRNGEDPGDFEVYDRTLRGDEGLSAEIAQGRQSGQQCWGDQTYTPIQGRKLAQSYGEDPRKGAVSRHQVDRFQLQNEGQVQYPKARIHNPSERVGRKPGCQKASLRRCSRGPEKESGRRKDPYDQCRRSGGADRRRSRRISMGGGPGNGRPRRSKNQKSPQKVAKTGGVRSGEACMRDLELERATFVCSRPKQAQGYEPQVPILGRGPIQPRFFESNRPVSAPHLKAANGSSCRNDSDSMGTSVHSSEENLGKNYTAEDLDGTGNLVGQFDCFAVVYSLRDVFAGMNCTEKASVMERTATSFRKIWLQEECVAYQWAGQLLHNLLKDFLWWLWEKNIALLAIGILILFGFWIVHEFTRPIRKREWTTRRLVLICKRRVTVRRKWCVRPVQFTHVFFGYLMLWDQCGALAGNVLSASGAHDGNEPGGLSWKETDRLDAFPILTKAPKAYVFEMWMHKERWADRFARQAQLMYMNIHDGHLKQIKNQWRDQDDWSRYDVVKVQAMNANVGFNGFMGARYLAYPQGNPGKIPLMIFLDGITLHTTGTVWIHLGTDGVSTRKLFEVLIPGNQCERMQLCSVEGNEITLWPNAFRAFPGAYLRAKQLDLNEEEAASQRSLASCSTSEGTSIHVEMEEERDESYSNQTQTFMLGEEGDFDWDAEEATFLVQVGTTPRDLPGRKHEKNRFKDGKEREWKVLTRSPSHFVSDVQSNRGVLTRSPLDARFAQAKDFEAVLTRSQTSLYESLYEQNGKNDGLPGMPDLRGQPRSYSAGRYPDEIRGDSTLGRRMQETRNLETFRWWNLRNAAGQNTGIQGQDQIMEEVFGLAEHPVWMDT